MRKVLALVAPPIAIIVLAVVVVVLAIPNEDPVKQGTLGAAIVGAGGFLLNYVRAAQKDDHERQKREEEGKEKLAVRPVVVLPNFAAELRARGIHDLARIAVEIYNPGPVANIQAVRVFATLDGEEKAEQLIVWERNRSVTEPSTNRHQFILEHKKAITFNLPVSSQFRNVFLLDEKRCTALSIIVQTFSGTTVEVQRKEIREAMIAWNVSNPN